METYLRRIRAGVVWFIRFENGNNSFWVNWDGCSSNPVLWVSDELKNSVNHINESNSIGVTYKRWAVGRYPTVIDVVKTLEVWNPGVDFNDNLLGRLKDFGTCTDGSACSEH